MESPVSPCLYCKWFVKTLNDTHYVMDRNRFPEPGSTVGLLFSTKFKSIADHVVEIHNAAMKMTDNDIPIVTDYGRKVEWRST